MGADGLVGGKLDNFINNASMRPRLRGRGWLGMEKFAAEQVTGFNEAAPAWARMDYFPLVVTTNIACFNEAAPAWARMVP